jgi:hypothetical protein
MRHHRHSWKIPVEGARSPRRFESLGVLSALLASSLLGCAAEVGDPAAEREVAVTTQALHINYGAWNANRPTTDVMAVHAALVPTSSWRTSSSARVLYWGGSQNDPALPPPFGTNNWRLFDPSNWSSAALSFNTTDTFCSGHAHMKDGKLLIVGGNEYYWQNIPYSMSPIGWELGDWQCAEQNVHRCHQHLTGTRTTYAFDFTNNTMTPYGNTARGRWYPTVVRTKGRGGYQLAVMGGHLGANNFPGAQGGHNNWDYEAIGSTTSWTRLADDTMGSTDHYPRVHLVPSEGGTTIMNSFTGGETVAFYEDTDGTPFGLPIASTPPEYGGIDTSSVLLPLRPNAQGVYPPGRIVVTGAPTYHMLNLSNFSAGWQPMTRPQPADGGGPRRRRHSNATILATGDVLVTGGYVDPADETTAVRYTEIYREDLNQWQEAASAVVGRNYHSTALLLPDGRVWTAGGNKRAGYSQTDNPNGRELRIEVFQPWYYSLSRPAILGSTGLVQPPTSGRWRINTASGTTGTSITRVALVAPGSVTHAFDVDQRYVELRVLARGSNYVEVSVPADPAVLPRGLYLLFISRSSNGNAAGAHVPSVGRWVRVP